MTGPGSNPSGGKTPSENEACEANVVMRTVAVSRLYPSETVSQESDDPLSEHVQAKDERCPLATARLPRVGIAMQGPVPACKPLPRL